MKVQISWLADDEIKTVEGNLRTLQDRIELTVGQEKQVYPLRTYQNWLNKLEAGQIQYLVDKERKYEIRVPMY